MNGSDAASIRTVRNPAIRWAGRRLKRLNDRHPWDHNAHFHPWILRNLPPDPQRVLDVGCGRGDLVAALRLRSAQVEGIDPDPVMAYAAATRFQGLPTVHISRRGFEELTVREELHGTYDAITMVASLHHMDLEPALEAARDLLRPGGRLLVVTLVEPRGTVDTLWDITNALTNPLMGFVKHPHPAEDARSVEDSRSVDAMPMRDAQFSVAVLREGAGAVLPGVRVRRRGAFRVTLRWEKPGR